MIPKAVKYVIFLAISLQILAVSGSQFVTAKEWTVIEVANNKMSTELIPPEVPLPTTTSAQPNPSANPYNIQPPTNPYSQPPPTNPYNSQPSADNASQPNNPYGSAFTNANSYPSQSPPAIPPNSAQPRTAEVVDNRPDPVAIIETDKGTIVIRLFRKYAPKTTANFIDLVNKSFYNGLTFHRVEPGFCIQGGCPRGDGFGVYVEPDTKQPRMLPLEISPYLKHNAPGVVAMAHFPDKPDSSSSQFYITLSAQPQLDGDYSIFGGVVRGMDVVNKIVKGDKMKSIIVQEQK